MSRDKAFLLVLWALNRAYSVQGSHSVLSARTSVILYQQDKATVLGVVVKKKCLISLISYEGYSFSTRPPICPFYQIDRTLTTFFHTLTCIQYLTRVTQSMLELNDLFELRSFQRLIVVYYLATDWYLHFLSLLRTFPVTWVRFPASLLAPWKKADFRVFVTTLLRGQRGYQ